MLRRLTIAYRFAHPFAIKILVIIMSVNSICTNVIVELQPDYNQNKLNFTISYSCLYLKFLALQNNVLGEGMQGIPAKAYLSKPYTFVL